MAMCAIPQGKALAIIKSKLRSRKSRLNALILAGNSLHFATGVSICNERSSTARPGGARFVVTGWRSINSICMIRFFRRFIGVLVLDRAAFEDVEADRHASTQAALVLLLVCLAGGLAGRGLGLFGVAGFVAGAAASLGAFAVWAAIVTTLGTITMPERQTSSNFRELLRVLGFASAPGVFVAFAAMRAAAPVVFAIVMTWMIAAAVVGVRQALDYRSLPRAIAVCVIGWLLSFGIVSAVLMLFSTTVS